MGSKLLRTNLLPNPSFEVDNLGITAARGALTRDSSKAYAGNVSLKYVTDGTVGGNYISNVTSKTPVTAGETYTLSGYMMRDATVTKWSMRFYWYDAANTLIASHTTAPYYDISDTSWTRISLTAEAPANAVTVMFYFIGEGTLASGTTTWLDAIMFEDSPSVGEYFDGSFWETQTRFYKWNGMVHGSTSSEYELWPEEWSPRGSSLANLKYTMMEVVLGTNPVQAPITESIANVKKAALEKVLSDNGLI